MEKCYELRPEDKTSLETLKSIYYRLKMDAEYEELKKSHIISEGMLPKLENCFFALQHGVSKIIIGNPSIIANKDQLSTTLTL